MWSDDLHVCVQSSSFHLILATVTISSSNQKFGLVCVYGDPYHRQTNLIWEQVASFVYNNCNLTMLCIGDMNELLYDMEKNPQSLTALV